MDGLIGLLITIGLFALTSSSRKKKDRKQRRAEYEARRRASQPKIPFSKDEWTAFLKEQQQAKAASRPQGAAAAPKPAPVLHVEHDEPEGTISTQGESAEVHAEHRQKILTEEAKRAEQHETLNQLRRLNTQKLRNAVVMGEVLGKPVSLRPRGTRY